MKSVVDLLAEAVVGQKKVVVLGVGSCLKCDDAAGVVIAEGLAEKLSSTKCDRVRIYNASTAPENFTGEIKRFNPDTLLIIDAADMGLLPGTMAFIEPTDVQGVSFSTHMLPLKIMLEYLSREIDCQIYILGIQGECIDFGTEITESVQYSIKLVTNTLFELLTQ